MRASAGRATTNTRHHKIGIATRLGVVTMAGALAMIVVSPPAWADSGSDSRATFTNGNVTTCAGIGLPKDTQVGSTSDGNASDADVAGVVKTNAGSVKTGQGEEVDVTITGSNIVIDAVMVKGGDGYNVYSGASVLPPVLQPDQHYIPPFNNGGNVPTISHWFACYSASGSGVPIGALGALGGTGLVAAGLGLVTWRSRRRRPVRIGA